MFSFGEHMYLSLSVMELSDATESRNATILAPIGSLAPRMARTRGARSPNCGDEK
jgi:hypothetical protein